MPTRRIAASACALCLIVPALAGAQPIHDPPAATPTSPQSTARVMGPSGTTNPTSPRSTAGLMGPSGTTKAAAHAAVASDGDATDGWRIAAVSEAALFAALALGSALILRARRAAPRMGM